MILDDGDTVLQFILEKYELKMTLYTVLCTMYGTKTLEEE